MEVSLEPLVSRDCDYESDQYIPHDYDDDGAIVAEVPEAQVLTHLSSHLGLLWNS